MAITTNKTILNSANSGIPSSYVPATLPALVDPNQEIDSVDLAVGTIEDADVATALSNLETDLQTYLDSTYYPDVLGLNSALTINSNVTVTKIERLRQVANDFNPGGEFFRVTFTVQWEQ
jgi:hypothetical protein